MIVVDTNVLAYGTLTVSDPVLRRQAEAISSGAEGILVPGLWRHEYLNTLVNYAQAEHLTLDEAMTAWYRTLALAQESEAPVNMTRALELSVELSLSGHDAQFLALVEEANTVLVTEDRRLRRAAGARAVSMEEHLAS